MLDITAHIRRLWSAIPENALPVTSETDQLPSAPEPRATEFVSVISRRYHDSKNSCKPRSKGTYEDSSSDCFATGIFGNSDHAEICWQHFTYRANFRASRERDSGHRRAPQRTTIRYVDEDLPSSGNCCQ